MAGINERPLLRWLHSSRNGRNGRIPDGGHRPEMTLLGRCVGLVTTSGVGRERTGGFRDKVGRSCHSSRPVDHVFRWGWPDVLIACPEADLASAEVRQI